MEETPWATRPQELYLVPGEIGEKFDVGALRERIRAGQLTADDEISIAGTDIWKPASQYPAFKDSFSLVTQKNAAASPMVHASTAVAAAAPSGGRVLAGIIYPFTSISAIFFIVFGFAAALNSLLLLPLLLLATIFSLAIIRTSADGETRAPEVNAVGGFFDWILDCLRLIAVAFIAAWPFIALMITFMVGARSVALIYVAAVVTLLYYPACLIAIARWKTVMMTLYVSKMSNLISTLGADYFVAVVMSIALPLAFAFARRSIAINAGVRLAHGFDAVATVYLHFYVAHLLGWAVYRHRDQLEY